MKFRRGAPTSWRSCPDVKGRAVGVDFGTKRVGLSVTDPLWLFAQPLGTFTPNNAIVQLRALQGESGIDVFVVGWPLLEDGSSGDAVKRVAEYIRRLRKVAPQAEVVRWDERYTTHRAREMIKLSGNPSLRKSGRGRIDTAAAGLILQEYLDEQEGQDR